MYHKGASELMAAMVTDERSYSVVMKLHQRTTATWNRPEGQTIEIVKNLMNSVGLLVHTYIPIYRYCFWLQLLLPVPVEVIRLECTSSCGITDQ